MDLNTDVNKTLLANKAKRDAALAQSTPVAETPAAPVQAGGQQTTIIQQPVAPVQTPANTPPAPPKTESVTPEKVEPVVEKKTPETPKPPVTETPQEEYKWDANIPDTTNKSEKTTAPAIDLKKIGSALNLEAQTEDEFITVVNQKLSKLKELETQSDSVPEQLKKAVEVAKKGGDWLAYTNATAFDATKIDPIDLFEREFERTEAANFRNADGSFNQEKFDEELDRIPDSMKRMQGNQIKAQLVARQQQQAANVLAQTLQQQEKFQKSLSDASKELSTLLPRDKFGITAEAKHASFLYEGISNGSLVRKHLGDIDPSVLAKMDGKKLMKTIAIAEFGENISQFQFKQGEVAGKKSLLKEAQNPELSGPSYVPRPEEQTTEAPSTADMLRKMQTSQKPKGSL